MDVLNLDSNLRELNSLATKDREFVQGVDFDINNDRGIINSAKIRNFSFNNAQGGTAVLGGSGDGNGVLLIKDTTGSTIVQGDSSGITVYNGNIVIKNDTNTTIIDSFGVNSVNTFPNNSVSSGSFQTTGSTSYIDLAGSSLNTLTVDRDTNVLIFAIVEGDNSDFLDSGDYMGFQIYDSYYSGGIGNDLCYGINATKVDWDTGTGLINSVATRLASQSVTLQGIALVLAGTHNYKLQYKAIGGGNAEVDFFTFGYVVLGS